MKNFNVIPLVISGLLFLVSSVSWARTDVRLSDALKTMQNQNYSLQIKRKSIANASLVILETVFSPVSISYSIGSSESETETTGEFFGGGRGGFGSFGGGPSTTNTNSFSLNLNISPSLPFDIASAGSSRAAQKAELQSQENQLAIALMSAYFSAISSDTIVEVIEYYKRSPELVLTLADRVADQNRANEIERRAQNAVNQLNFRQNEIRFVKQEAEISYYDLVIEEFRWAPTVEPDDVLDEDGEQVFVDNAIRQDSFSRAVSRLRDPKEVRLALDRAAETFFDNIPIPETPEDALAIAILKGPGIKAARHRLSAAQQRHLGQWANTVLPTLSASLSVSNSDNTTFGFSSETFSTRITGTWRFSGGTIPRLKRSGNSVDSAELSLNKAEKDTYVALRKLYPRLEKIKANTILATDTYVQNYTALVEVLNRLDVERPDPDLLEEIIDANNASVDARIAMENVISSLYIATFQLYALIEDFQSLYSRVVNLEGAFEVAAQMRDSTTR